MMRRGRRLGFSLATLVLASAASCAHRPVPVAEDNAVVRYLLGAERQVETPEQEQEIVKALEDLRTLPPERLRASRYADYGLVSGQWTLVQLLQRYFVPRAPLAVDAETLYRSASDPRARAVVDEHLRAIREHRQAREPWRSTQRRGRSEHERQDR